MIGSRRCWKGSRAWSEPPRTIRRSLSEKRSWRTYADKEGERVSGSRIEWTSNAYQRRVRILPQRPYNLCGLEALRRRLFIAVREVGLAQWPQQHIGPREPCYRVCTTFCLLLDDEDDVAVDTQIYVAGDDDVSNALISALWLIFSFFSSSRRAARLSKKMQ